MENESVETPIATDAAAVSEPQQSEPANEVTTEQSAVESVEQLYSEIIDPQLYATSYVTDDYVITLVHDITLGDFLIATLLCVLIVVQIFNTVLRRW